MSTNSRQARLYAGQVERMRVDVETCSPLSAGQTVCDVWHQSGKPKNVTVAKVCSLVIYTFATLYHEKTASMVQWLIHSAGCQLLCRRWMEAGSGTLCNKP